MLPFRLTRPDKMALYNRFGEAITRHCDLGWLLGMNSIFMGRINCVVHLRCGVALDSRRKIYDGILSLIEGLDAEFDLVTEWAAGDGGNQGYVSKTRPQLANEHPDWFNPSRAVFKFSTPVLNNVNELALRQVLNTHYPPSCDAGLFDTASL